MDARLRRGPTISMFFALFCFMLPFLTISCPGGSARFNGVELAVGTTVEQEGGAKQRLNPEPLAAIALGLTIVAALVSVFTRRGNRIATGAIAGLNLLLLILMKSKIEHDALMQGKGMFQVTWGFGYWLALLGYASTVATVILLLGDKSPSDRRLAPNLEPATASPAIEDPFAR